MHLRWQPTTWQLILSLLAISPTVLVLAPAKANPRLAYGPKTCIEGYVWREAFPGDQVCVRPTVRVQAAFDNSQVSVRVQPGGGASGPFTCRNGFVWREAQPDDKVCVIPPNRTQAQRDNLLAEHRYLRNYLP
jgi:hypothetical protein